MEPNTPLSLTGLAEAMATGAIDTVIVAFTDHYGRLMGKRFDASFFLDEATALAAGHRPCGLCRREQYLSYRTGVTEALAADKPVLANELH